LNHIKRCAKKHGVTAQEIRLNDDCDAFTTSEDNNSNFASGRGSPSDVAQVDNDTEKIPASTLVNPYLKSRSNTKWHTGASEDLALADSTTVDTLPNHRSSTASGWQQQTAKKQTSVTNFFQAPLRSLNNVLLTSAKRVAKTAEVNAKRVANKQQQGQGGGRWGKQRKSYSNVRVPLLIV
jgi:hypothetical protein